MPLYVSIKKKLRDYTLNIHFETQKGVLGLLGTSGCGKSITLKCIAGIIQPDEGIIRLNDTVLFDSEKKISLAPQKRKIGYLFQNYALFPNMNVEQNIAAGIAGKTKEKQPQIDKAIKQFFLTGLEKAKPNQLSGGQQQRVAFARMMSANPKTILLDEPFSALDSYLKWKIQLEIQEILSSFKGETIFVSHNRDEIYDMCETIQVISQGKIVEGGTKSAIFDNPQTYASALLTGCKNISLAKKIDDYTLFAKNWNIELHSDTKIPDELQYVGVRSHYIISVNSNKQADIQNQIECTVKNVIEGLFTDIIMLNINKSEETFLRWEVNKGSLKCTIGDNIFVQLPKQDLLLLK